MSEMKARDRTWQCVEVACNPLWIDHLGFEISERFKVITELTEKGVRFYLDTVAWNPDWERTLKKFLTEFGRLYRHSGPLSYRVTRIKDQDWGLKWKTHFKPIRAGNRLWIAPPWESFEPPPDSFLVKINPGRAFGTGHHETTRLCLAWLERYKERADVAEKSLLDVGTGTGIIAITGALLGFSSVVGVDYDTGVLLEAKRNIALNPGAGNVRLVAGTTDCFRGRFDVIVANIELSTLIHMVDDFVSLLCSSGKLVVSGVLTSQCNRLIRAYRDRRMILVGMEEAGEWSLIEWGKG